MQLQIMFCKNVENSDYLEVIKFEHDAKIKLLEARKVAIEKEYEEKIKDILITAPASVQLEFLDEHYAEVSKHDSNEDGA